MKKGFTILELLVASLLLGMLLTILTMIFNQSSIAWRAGEAGIADMTKVRFGVSRVRYESDNLYSCNGDNGMVLGIFRSDGTLRTRSFSLGTSDRTSDERIQSLNTYIDPNDESGKSGEKIDKSMAWTINPSAMALVMHVGQVHDEKTYTVNVRSAGPNRKHGDYDDIWSFPDEFDLE